MVLCEDNPITCSRLKTKYVDSAFQLSAALDDPEMECRERVVSSPDGHVPGTKRAVGIILCGASVCIAIDPQKMHYS